MATPVEMPQLGNTVDECSVTKWVKRPGDAVSTGDVVLEIETDKTTFEVIAPVEGTVLATFFEEGALVPVFTNIFVIGNPGEDADAFRPGRTGAERSAPARRAEPMPAAAGSPQTRSGEAPAPYSPRARRFAAARHFHPDAVPGSGPGGRVLERDLRKAYDASASTSGAASSLRQTIARRMRESLASTAQYTMNASADATGLLALRARIKSTPGLPDITINDLVTWCTIKALLETPDLNAEFRDGRIVRHSEIHIAFAVDTPRGLIAPVVRNSHTLSAADLARRTKELTGQAIHGTISADDLAGATFTISSLGSLGIESFTPLLNPPQVAILGVGAIQPKPVRRRGTIEFTDSIGLSLTCDHQAVDGAPGARFLQAVSDRIQNVEEICRI